MAISRGDGGLIAAIYDAVIDPSRWDDVVKRIVEATKSVSGGILTNQLDAGQLTALAIWAEAVAIGLLRTPTKCELLTLVDKT